MSFCDTLKDSLDYSLSVSPFFLINQKGSVSSWFSIILTWLLLILALISSSHDIFELFLQKEPEVSWDYYQDFNPEFLPSDDLNLLFTLTDKETGHSFFDETYFDMRLRNLYGYGYGETIKTEKVIFEGKEYLKVSKNQSNPYRRVFYEEIGIGGNMSKSFEITVMKCLPKWDTDKEEPIDNCKTDIEIKNMLNRLSLSIVLNNNKLDTSNRNFVTEHLKTNMELSNSVFFLIQYIYIIQN